MADQEEAYSLASTFPNPPPFWRDFTTDRITRITQLREAAVADQSEAINKKESKDGEDTGPDAEASPIRRIPNLPDDLVTLRPPPEPADGRWRVFGDQYTLKDELPTLEEQGITNLPATYAQQIPSHTSNSNSSGNNLAPPPPPSSSQKHYDRALELKRFAKSILLNFLELAGTLSLSPASDAQPKAADLRTLLINMHHALNEYRPHQARESVIEMMQDHLDRTRRETLAIRTQVDRARRVLEGLGSLAVPGAGAAAGVAMDGMGVDGKGEDGGKDGYGDGDGEGGGSERREAQSEEMKKLRLEREQQVWAATNEVFT